MKKSLLQYLACPSCGGDIHLTAGSEDQDQEILDGVLSCKSCAKHFQIVRGVPRFVQLDQLDEEMAATASSLGWLQPVTPEFFQGKVVLEGGCGKGRHTQLAAKWGARDVIGVDLSDAVESAFATTRGSENMHIIQADLCRLPLKQMFDYAFSIGVIHHLEEPQAGFQSLASKVKPNGHFS